MTTHGYQFPIPIYQVGHAVRGPGPQGNTAYPIGILELPMSAAAYLFFRAATVQKTTEWTPLSTGPGARIDYTGATGWDGTKFVVQSTERFVTDPLGIYQQAPPYGLASDQEVRDLIRGYDPLNPGPVTYPGVWMGIGQVSAEGTLSENDGTMRYDLPGSWTQAQTDFTDSNTEALAGWLTRLQNWLAAEQAKPTPDAALIADIQRQIQVQAALVTEVGTAQTASITEAATQRQSIIDNGGTTAEADQWGTNLLTAEQEAFARWIAAEELLESFSVTVFPLREMRVDFKRWALQMLQGKWLGWQRDLESTGLGIGICGARLATAMLGSLSSGGIPALGSAQLALNISRPLPNIVYAETTADLKNAGTDALATIFQVSTDPYTIDTGLETRQVTSILTVGVGPATIGLSPAACSVQIGNGYVIPNYLPPVKIIDGGLESGETSEAVTCPVDNPDCNPYVMRFFELYDSEGAEIPYTGQLVGDVDGDKSWAFQSPYATYASGPPEVFNVTPLRTLWGPVASLVQALNVGTQNGVVCGKFRITNPDDAVIFETDLFTTPNTVGALNIIWKILTLRP